MRPPGKGPPCPRRPAGSLDTTRRSAPSPERGERRPAAHLPYTSPQSRGHVPHPGLSLFGPRVGTGTPRECGGPELGECMVGRGLAAHPVPPFFLAPRPRTHPFYKPVAPPLFDNLEAWGPSAPPLSLTPHPAAPLTLAPPPPEGSPSPGCWQARCHPGSPQEPRR